MNSKKTLMAFMTLLLVFTLTTQAVPHEALALLGSANTNGSNSLEAEEQAESTVEPVLSNEDGSSDSGNVVIDSTVEAEEESMQALDNQDTKVPDDEKTETELLSDVEAIDMSETAVLSNEIDLTGLYAGEVSVSTPDWTYDCSANIVSLNSSVSYTLQGSAPLSVVALEGIAASITLQNISIDLSGSSGSPLSLVGADIHLIVVGVNTLIAGGTGAGISVPQGASLTISGSGCLRASGAQAVSGGGAGIGGNAGSSAGSLTIAGGIIEARGGTGAAGIGGGASGDTGSIILPQTGVLAEAGGAGTSVQAGAAVGAGGAAEAAGSMCGGIRQVTYSDTSNMITLCYTSDVITLPRAATLKEYKHEFSVSAGSVWLSQHSDEGYAFNASYALRELPAIEVLTLGEIAKDTVISEQANDDDAAEGTTTHQENSNNTILRFPGQLPLSPESGKASPPVLFEGSALRTGENEATVSFSSTADGQFYYVVVEAGAPAPYIATAAKGVFCYQGENSFVLSGLSEGPKDVYISAKDATGRLCQDKLKLHIDAYIPSPVLTGGETQRYEVSTGSVSFTSNMAGEYYYALVPFGEEAPSINTSGNGFTCVEGLNTIELSGLTPGAHDVYVISKNASGVVGETAICLTLLPTKATTDTQAQSAGSFIVVAVAEGELVVTPKSVAYHEGDTIATALIRSGGHFVGLEENFVVSVEKHTGHFMCWAQSKNSGTTCQLPLNTTPEKLDGGMLLLIDSVETQEISSAMLSLGELMVRYQTSDLSQLYGPATTAYSSAVSRFVELLSDEEECALLHAELLTALNEAETQLDEANTNVNFKVSLGSEPLSFSEVEIRVNYITYGSSHLVENGSIRLPEGSFTFEIFYAAHNKRATGNIEISADDTDTDITVSFPEEPYWLAHLRIFHKGTAQETTYGDIFDGDISTYMTNSRLCDLIASRSSCLPPYLGAIAVLPEEFAQKYPNAKIWFHGNKTLLMRSGKMSILTDISHLKYSIGGPAIGCSFEVVNLDPLSGITYSQSHDHTIERIRTVGSITITDGVNTLLSKEERSKVDPAGLYTIDGTRVTVPAQTSEVYVDAMATTSYNEGNYLLINGEKNTGSTVTIPLAETSTEIYLQACNSDGSYGDVVVVTLVKSPASSAEITVENNVGLILRNDENGIVVKPVQTTQNISEGTTTYRYALAAEQRYSYTATKDTYYRVINSFTAEHGTVLFEPEFETDDLLNSVAVNNIEDPIFTQQYPVQKESSISILDCEAKNGYSRFYAHVTLKENAPSDKVIYAVYSNSLYNPSENYSGRQIKVLLPADGSVKWLHGLFGNSIGTRMEFIVEGTNSKGETVQQVYVLNIQQTLTLWEGSTPSFTVDGTEFSSKPETIEKDVYDYEVIVPVGASEVTLNVKSWNFANIIATIQGVPQKIPPNLMITATLPLEGTEDEAIEMILTSTDGSKSTYRFTIMPRGLIDVAFSYTPEHANFHLYSMSEQEIIPNEDGSYSLTEDVFYRYTLVANGYVTMNEQFRAKSTNMHIDMVEVEPNDTIDPSIEADWGSFRGENNNAITETHTPTSPDETVAYWYTRTGGMSNVGQVIFVNGCLVTTAASGTTEEGGVEYNYSDGYHRLIMLDPISGEVIAEGITMSPGGVIPTYAEGMIFVPGSGTVQAFNANPREQTDTERASGLYTEGVKVLDSLWYYSDPSGGAAYNAVYYKDGHVYANWFNKGADTALVCLSITDENPSETHEAKLPVWRWVRSSGFYWAGACVTNGFVVVGGDGPSGVACLDAATGEALDWIENTGDVRSTVSYDETTDRFYFTSKAGYFYSTAIDSEGQFYDTHCVSLTAVFDQGGPAGASTSTPVVYNGRAYIGIQGTGGFGAFTGHRIAVIDLASHSIAYTVETKGYVQSSGLVSTAYEDVPHLNPQTGEHETGFVYVYFVENVNPGRISYLIDKPGLTEPYATTTEYDGRGDRELAPILFDTRGVNGQYCLTSCTVDAYGTMYIKTDKGQIIAVGSRITDLELVKEPDNTVYIEGSKFDATGIQVAAHYANGLSRDVTDYMLYPGADTPFVQGDNSVFALFPYSLYNDRTPDAQLDSSEEAIYAELEGIIQMNKIARPSLNVSINVITSDEALTVEDVKDAIDAIGEVELSEECKALIETARSLYDDLNGTPQLQRAVSNYDVLLAAELRYQQLEHYSAGTVPFADILTEANNVSFTSTGPVRMISDTEELFAKIPATYEEALATEEGQEVAFYLESARVDMLTQNQRTFVETLTREQNLTDTPVVYSVTLFKQVGAGEKVEVVRLLGTSKVELEFLVPEDQQSYGRVFKLINIHTFAAQVLNDLAVGHSAIVISETNRFSTFVLTYLKESGQTVVDNDPPQSNVTVEEPTSGGRHRYNGPSTAAYTSGVASNVNVSNESEDMMASSVEGIRGGENESGENAYATTVITDEEKALSEAREAGENLGILLVLMAVIGAAGLVAVLLYWIISRKKKNTEPEDTE